MRRFREFLKRTLPTPVVNWLRRWLGTARYLRFMSHEVYRRQSHLETGSHLEPLEQKLAARRDGLYQQIVGEVVERSDLVLQQLDRKVEGQGARHDERLRALEEEIARLRESLEQLRSAIEGAGGAAGAERSGSHPTRERAARRRKLADAASE